MKAILGSALALVVSVGASLAHAEPPVAPPPAAKVFVSDLSTQILGVLNGPADQAAKYNEVCNLVAKYTDIVRMANESLGKNRRLFPAEMLPAYYVSYQSMLATLLGGAFERMKTAKITIYDQVSGTPEEQVVAALVEAPSRAPMRVQFYLSPDAEAGFKLIDASLSGARLIMAKRTSFDSTLAGQMEDPNKGAQMLIDSINEANPSCGAQ